MSEYEIYKCMSYKEQIEDDLRPVIRATIEDLDKELLDTFIKNIPKIDLIFQNIVEKIFY